MHYTLFSTAIGECGLAWNERGVTQIQLPESTDARTRARMCERAPAAHECAPSGAIAVAISGITALVGGQRVDLGGVVLDMERVPAFHRRVYELARQIPPGETRTYGELASALGDPGAARAVGQALGDNPFPIVVPCHRVLAAAGRPGGFSAYGGTATKRQLLVIEGAIPDQGRLFPDQGH